jgi:hypothetical protein
MSLISLVFIVVILACNISVAGVSDKPNLALTITAQALLLQQQSGKTSTPAPVPEVPSATNSADIAVVNTFTAIPTDTVLPSATPTLTPSTLTVTVSTETNCRKGPGVAFDSIYSLPVGQTAEVVGKNTLTSYWIIKMPGGGTCWLWDKYASVSGDTSGLVEFVTPTPVPPAAPVKLSEQNTCSLNPDQSGLDYIVSGTVTWQDNSNNENGFNIYWNTGFASAVDILVGTVGPNVTSFEFGSQQTYSDMINSVKVEAFNDAGVSKKASVKIVLNCQ